VTVSTPEPAVAVVGSTMIDLVSYASRVPGPGETLIGESFAMGFGGKGANQAVMARLLGARVTMINCVGDDSYGEMTRANLDGFGIDTTHVHVAPGSSGVAQIWVEPDGTNRIIIVPGANHHLTPEQAVAAVESMEDVAIVVGQFEIPQGVTAAAFEAARRRGATTILNPAPGAPIDAGLLAATDWLIPNEVELGEITGSTTGDDDMLRAASDLAVGMVVTLGEAGAALVSPDEGVRRFPAPRVTPVDTTGAGDAFVGSFAFALAAGWAETDAVALGILCAADSVTRHGTQTSYPGLEAARTLMSRARSSA
jgi:ribokinase